MLSYPGEKESQINSILYKLSQNIEEPLRSTLDITKEALAEVSDEKLAQYLNKIKVNTEKIQLVLEELFNATQFEVKDPLKEKINFQELISDILISLQFLPSFKNLDIIINIQQHYDFYSDVSILYSILKNLIENSIKFQDDKKGYSYLKIKVQVSEDTTKIELDDNGIGIEETSRINVFDMFFRATEKASGNGLGLFVVKKSVERLNGSIVLQSKFGLGTSINLIFHN